MGRPEQETPTGRTKTAFGGRTGVVPADLAGDLDAPNEEREKTISREENLSNPTPPSIIAIVSISAHCSTSLVKSEEVLAPE